VLAACRVLAGVSAQSVAAVEDVVDLIQFRALVVVASRGSVSLGELAEATQIHLSRASRMCDRMVGMGLRNRADDPANRRQLIVTLTPEGRRIGEEVIGRRRAAVNRSWRACRNSVARSWSRCCWSSPPQPVNRLTLICGRSAGQPDSCRAPCREETSERS
jgi:DNA-binding MarR family transcriptional regulator